jgi:chromosomal replication initiation ATPase DnaA
MITPTQIKKDIEILFFIDNLATRYRGTNECMARYIYFTLCRNFTGASYNTIGKLVDRDHATVIVGINKLENLLKYYNAHANIFAELENKYKKEINKAPPEKPTDEINKYFMV